MVCYLYTAHSFTSSWFMILYFLFFGLEFAKATPVRGSMCKSKSTNSLTMVPWQVALLFRFIMIYTNTNHIEPHKINDEALKNQRISSRVSHLLVVYLLVVSDKLLNAASQPRAFSRRLERLQRLFVEGKWPHVFCQSIQKLLEKQDRVTRNVKISHVSL